MTVRFKTRKSDAIENLVDFFEWFQRRESDNSAVELYRGHDKDTYELKPSLFREKAHRKDEKNIFANSFLFTQASLQETKMYSSSS
jgi:hypothetical protein